MQVSLNEKHFSLPFCLRLRLRAFKAGPKAALYNYIVKINSFITAHLHTRKKREETPKVPSS